jgi:hypothetical protein
MGRNNLEIGSKPPAAFAQHRRRGALQKLRVNGGSAIACEVPCVSIASIAAVPWRAARRRYR